MGLLAHLEAALGTIPAAFWGVVVGSFFSLSGVVLSNRANERRQRLQLQHERAVRKEDRELGLRKDIYLSAIETIQAGLVLVGNMADLDVTMEEHMRTYLDGLPALAKVQIIASMETMEAVVEISGSLSSSITLLTGKRIPLYLFQQRLLAMKAQVAGFEKERDRWLEEMKRYNIACSPNAQLWATLQGNFTFEEKRVSETYAQFCEESMELFSKQMDFIQECLDSYQDLSSLIVPVVLAIRCEIGMLIDKRRYEEIMQALILKQRTTAVQLIDTVREAVHQAQLTSKVTSVT